MLQYFKIIEDCNKVCTQIILDPIKKDPIFHKRLK